jgi:hypothetical protein
MSDEQQAFNELRMKQNELQKQLMQVSSQQGMKERQKRKSELTTAELAELPAGTNLYRSVGKTCALFQYFWPMSKLLSPVIIFLLIVYVLKCLVGAFFFIFLSTAPAIAPVHAISFILSTAPAIQELLENEVKACETEVASLAV